MRKYYFAYGSNMDEDRMKKRGVKFYDKFAARLDGYRLVFQNFIKYGNSYANIIKDKDSFVEGVAYEVDESVNILDKFEHIPINYFRRERKVKVDGENITCIVYIGNLENIGDEEIPSVEYLSHLLKGKKLLSDKYFKKIEEIYKKAIVENKF